MPQQSPILSLSLAGLAIFPMKSLAADFPLIILISNLYQKTSTPMIYIFHPLKTESCLIFAATRCTAPNPVNNSMLSLA